MSGISKIEIEYKFGISHSDTFTFLSNLTSAGDYVIKEKSHPLFTDYFYDTPDLLLYSLGFYLRKRLEDGREDAVWTMKQSQVQLQSQAQPQSQPQSQTHSQTQTESQQQNKSGTESDEAHRRHEMIQTLSLDSTVEDITDPDMKKTLMSILGDSVLIPVLTLKQDRIFKTVFKKGIKTDADESEFEKPENRLGDLSVDSVSLTLTDQKHTFTELEIELANGTESELSEFIETLKGLPELRDNLYSSSFSKFDRGLILYFNRDKIEGKVIPGFEKKSYFTDLDSKHDDEGIEGLGTYDFDSTGSGFLLPREKASLMQICEKEYTADPTDYFGTTGFLSSSGKTGETDVDADTANTGTGALIDTNYLFGQKAAVLLALDSGMSLGFAARAFQLEETELNSIREQFEQNRLEMFPFAFETGMNEAYYFQKPIEDGRVWTVDELADIYGLDSHRAEYYSEKADRIFEATGPAYGLTERDRLLLNAAAELSGIGRGLSVERKINIAADIILTHPIEDLTLNEMKTLALIFVLRKVKKPAPGKIRETIKEAGFFLQPALQKKAVIIAMLLEKEVKKSILATEKSRETGELNQQTECKKIKSYDMMAVAAEKILISQFTEVEKAEPGVISARDIEDVHDMRVALRKIRSANIIFKDFIEPEWLAETEADIKKTLSGLGEMRDLDVLLEKTEEWTKLNEKDPADLSVFDEFVKRDRKKAHSEAVKYLTSAEYLRFKTDFVKTLKENVYLGMPHINKKGDVMPVRICDVLPAILYEKAADITAYHEWMDGPYIYVDKLHRLRIAAKNFRYTLDFFKECLGESAAQLIKEFKELQDILGDFHDAVVAVDVIGAYINRIEEANRAEKEDGKRKQEIEKTLETLSRYRNDREREMEELLAAFHTKWEKMDRRFFSERIAKIITEADF